MQRSPLIVSADAVLERRARAAARRVPDLRGRPIRLQRAPGLQDRHGPVHAASFVRERRIAFDCTVAEFPRILVHELFHFAWLHMGNPLRWSYEELVRMEWGEGSRGELGWSAEWRKGELSAGDIRRRSRRWREYCCESFCDTAAWLYCGIRQHPEYTLPQLCRRRRQAWFEREMEPRGLSI